MVFKIPDNLPFRECQKFRQIPFLKKLMFSEKMISLGIDSRHNRKPQFPMDISTFVYQKLYDMLIDQFAERELSVQDRERLGNRSYLIWEVEDDKDEKGPFLRIFGTHTVCKRYFYRKRSELNPDRAEKGPIGNGVLITALEYIGLQVPVELKKTTLLSVSAKAQILYQVLLETHFPEFWQENSAELKIYDHKTHSILNKAIKNKPFTPVTLTKDMTDQSPVNTEEEAVKELISGFHKAISDRRYEDAWNRLTPHFQKRVWNEEFERFKIGYTNTISIHDLHIFHMTKKATDVTCKVYYDDSVTSYTSLELSNLNKATVGKLESFNERIKTIQETAETIGLKGFEKIELHKFFEPAVSEYLWYKCGINPEQIGELLPSQEIITLPRLYHITCTTIDDQWLIKGIYPIKNNMIR